MEKIVDVDVSGSALRWPLKADLEHTFDCDTGPLGYAGFNSDLTFHVPEAVPNPFERNSFHVRTEITRA